MLIVVHISSRTRTICNDHGWGSHTPRIIWKPTMAVTTITVIRNIEIAIIICATIIIGKINCQSIASCIQPCVRIRYIIPTKCTNQRGMNRKSIIKTHTGMASRQIPLGYENVYTASCITRLNQVCGISRRPDVSVRSIIRKR